MVKMKKMNNSPTPALPQGEGADCFGLRPRNDVLPLLAFPPSPSGEGPGVRPLYRRAARHCEERRLRHCEGAARSNPCKRREKNCWIASCFVLLRFACSPRSRNDVSACVIARSGAHVIARSGATKRVIARSGATKQSREAKQ